MTRDGDRPSRRQLLTGAGLAAAGGFAVGPRTLAAAPASDRSNGDWPMPGRTPARTGFAPSATEFGGSLAVDWSCVLDETPISASLAVVDDVAYVTTARHLVALDAHTGDQRWRYHHDSDGATTSHSSLLSIPTGWLTLVGVGEDAVYVTSGTSVVAIDRSSGRRRWDFQTDACVVGSLPAGDLIVCSTGFRDDDLVAVDAETGSRRWSASAPNLLALAFAGGRLFGVHHRGRVVAVDPTSGTVRWNEAIGGEVNAGRPIVAAHESVVVREPAAVVALDATGGARRWTYPLDGDDASAAVGATDDAVAVADGSSATVASLDPASGDPQWTTEVEGLVARVQPVTTPSAWFVSVREGVVALDPASGDELARASVDPDFHLDAALALVDDRLYVASGESLQVVALSVR